MWRYNSRMIMCKFSKLVLILLFFSFNLHAEKVKGPSPSKAGNLSVDIVASGSPKYIEDWLTNSRSEGVTIKRLKEAKPNQLIVISFLVSGMTPNLSQNYAFSVSMYIEQPDGKLLFGKKDYARGSGKSPNVASFVMADPALDLILEHSDPEGVYKVYAQVKDLVSNKTSKASYEIKFSK